jgi:probable F420-dependent oxidoreductase
LTLGVTYGVALPHRSPTGPVVDAIRDVAVRADSLGFADLWVTENTLDPAFSFEPFAILSYVAALTERVGLGVSIVVLPQHNPIHVAHSVASLDVLSAGRAILGVGLGVSHHYKHFQVPTEQRGRRLVEGVELMKMLWSARGPVEYAGEVFRVGGSAHEPVEMTISPVQRPHPPIWMGGSHSAALKRVVQSADGWMGSGKQSTEDFKTSVRSLGVALEQAGRAPSSLRVSKRVFVAVDDRASKARSTIENWFGSVYHDAGLAAGSGVYGTPEDVQEKLSELHSAGATHLVLNMVDDYAEQIEALASVTGLSESG